MNVSPINTAKNRDREPPTFANINLLGKCNADCFFCLGKDIENLLSCHNQLNLHFSSWKNFNCFLDMCRKNSIKKIYITGQNTDSLLYKYLGELIDYLKEQGFDIGLRTNGFLALQKMYEINRCTLSVGYSIHTLNDITQKMILGRKDIPDWENILRSTNNPRVQIVLNRCNQSEFWDILRFLNKFPNIRYVQARRISTDTRIDFLMPDMAAYEQVYSMVSKIFPLKERMWKDAEVYRIYDMDVCFWRTVKTSVNSINYFTDGTLSDEYFVVEGYLKNYKKDEKN